MELQVYLVVDVYEFLALRLELQNDFQHALIFYITPGVPTSSWKPVNIIFMNKNEWLMWSRKLVEDVECDEVGLGTIEVLASETFDISTMLVFLRSEAGSFCALIFFFFGISRARISMGGGREAFSASRNPSNFSTKLVVESEVASE
jgi:hypothetical protein